MEYQTENPEDVDRLLSVARKALQDFEDGVDRKRLLLRLRTASPAHPVLLARFLFGGLGLLCVIAAIVVMAITQVNNDLARELAKFEMVIPYVPEDIPALPALLGLLALCMGFAWVMATLAALSLGRDATMLPWEQKQHQKLVNEVTRLTTQKAVMERIRSTPAGARPRIATPVPVAARRLHPTPAGAGSALSRGSFSRSTPSGAPSYAAPVSPKATPGGEDHARNLGFGPSPGGFGARGGLSRPPLAATPAGAAARPAGTGAPPKAPPGYAPTNGSGGRAWSGGDEVPDLDLDPSPPAPAGGVRLGARSVPPAGGVRLGTSRPPRAPAIDDLADLVEVGATRGDDARPEGPNSADMSAFDEAAPADPSGRPPDGILGRARAGGAAHLRSTPYGSAGRVRPPPSSSVPLSQGAAPATRGGTPLGAPPKAGVSVAKAAPRLSAPLGFPGTPERADRRADAYGATPRLPGGIFGTPAPTTRKSKPPLAAQRAPDLEDEASVMEEDEDAPTVRSATSATVSAEAMVRRLPEFAPIEEAWLEEALHKAEGLLRSFPMQAYLEFNQEPNLPFTLVIARATPAMAVRAMVNFVEFLAGIATPVRARIELVNVAHLDRSFHKNVEAALEPYFGGNVEIEPNPGRVDIRFTDPDPQWGAWPQLPIVGE